jgi:hypothetical protein
MTEARRERTSSTAESLHLPPRNLWLFDPRHETLKPTPHQHGIVDKFALVSLVKSTVEPSYDWASSFSDDHHLQWPDRWYSPVNEDDFNGQLFRNLSERKILVPRIFHNWTHLVTEPAPMPTEEVMREYLESRLIVKSLHDLVGYAKYLSRKSSDKEAMLQFHLEQRFDKFATLFEQARHTPQEFQVIDFNQYRLESLDDMVTISKRLGRHAVKTAPIPVISPRNLTAAA